jgi:hypothetical protein
MVSADLLNRSLWIHLAPQGDIHQRRSPVGSPKHEYLPQHQEQMEAELHGMNSSAANSKSVSLNGPYGVGNKVLSIGTTWPCGRTPSTPASPRARPSPCRRPDRR